MPCNVVNGRIPAGDKFNIERTVACVIGREKTSVAVHPADEDVHAVGRDLAHGDAEVRFTEGPCILQLDTTDHLAGRKG